MNKWVKYGLGAILILAIIGAAVGPTKDKAGETNQIQVASNQILPTQTEAPVQTQTTSVNNVTTIKLSSAEIQNWDADAEGDGIELTIEPLDKDGDQVQIKGVVDVRLYNETLNYQTYKTDKALAAEWKDVPIGQKYTFSGTSVQLNFDEGFDYKDAAGLYGFSIQVDFKYQGQTYSAAKEYVSDRST